MATTLQNDSKQSASTAECEQLKQQLKDLHNKMEEQKGINAEQEVLIEKLQECVKESEDAKHAAENKLDGQLKTL